ncbi:MAG: hypothetical protein AABZ14_02015 [Candidatus Margulisiibacteriota bacterium]
MTDILGFIGSRVSESGNFATSKPALNDLENALLSMTNQLKVTNASQSKISIQSSEGYY